MEIGLHGVYILSIDKVKQGRTRGMLIMPVGTGLDFPDTRPDNPLKVCLKMSVSIHSLEILARIKRKRLMPCRLSRQHLLESINSPQVSDDGIESRTRSE